MVKCVSVCICYLFIHELIQGYRTYSPAKAAISLTHIIINAALQNNVIDADADAALFLFFIVLKTNHKNDAI